MYTAKDREDLLNELILYSRTIEDVQGFLVVGSGSTGFRDQYSDLDVIVVVESSELVTSVHDVLRQFIDRNYCVLKQKVYQHEEDIFVTCFLFDNGLELDLGVWSFTKLRATKPDWNIKFDHKNTIQAKLEETLRLHKAPDLDEELENSLSFIWQFVQASAVSIKRKQLIKATKDLEIIRDQIIRLACIKNGIYYDYPKHIDSLDSHFVQKLIHTYQTNMSVESVTQQLIEVIDLYFEVIASVRTSREINKDKRILKEYINKIM